MRKLVVTENVTLDGVADEMDRWFSPFGDDDLEAVNRTHMATADAVLVGRVTYTEFKDFWPRQSDDPTGVSEYLNRTRKFVVSSTLTEAEADWEQTTILRGSPAVEIAALKAQPGKDIVLCGSISLAQTVLRDSMADEFRIYVYPVIIGHGRRLFPDGADINLRLVDSRTFAAGVVLLTYQPVRDSR